MEILHNGALLVFCATYIYYTLQFLNTYKKTAVIDSKSLIWSAIAWSGMFVYAITQLT